MSTEQSIQEQSTRTPARAEQRPTFAPAVDVFENKDEILVLSDLPGVETPDLEVSFEKEKLSFRAKRTKNGKTFDYARSFVVPNGIDAEHISAELKHGVLTLRLPKSAALKPRAIAVKTG
jgi:HSP20 family molecular chaperone IbpA